MRALTSEEAEGPWSDIGEGRANRAPRSTEPSNLQPFLTLLWGGDDSIRTLNDKFADDDGDSLTYSASAQYPGVLRLGIEGENSDKLRIHVLNPATSSVTYRVSDGYGGYASKTIDVSGSAEAFNGADLSRSVAENSAAGTAVGAPVTGTPYDDGDDQTDDALTLHADRRGGDLRGLRHRLGHRPDQRQARRPLGLRGQELLHRSGELDRAGAGSLRRRHDHGNGPRSRQARRADGHAHTV